MTASKPSVCLLIPNSNGIAHLQDCLSTAVAAAARYGRSSAVVLVDNRSADDSVAFSRRAFPSVEVVLAPRNDFLFSLNDVVRARAEDIVVVLNNDMRFDPDFIAPLVLHFADPDVFAVGAAIQTWDGTTDTVGPRLARVGRCWFYKWWRTDEQRTALTLEASGGAAAYRRGMFVALGGFDPLYRPGYYEDLDLSVRGWARGWKAVYEPGSRVYHKISVSMLTRHGQTEQDRLFYRNHVLFTVKNVGGAAFLAGFLILLPLRAIRPLLRGNAVPLAGLLRALPRLPRALLARSRNPGRLDLSRFEEVLSLEPVTAADTMGTRRRA
jgi:GT2 family glycosyltransferase